MDHIRGKEETRELVPLAGSVGPKDNCGEYGFSGFYEPNASKSESESEKPA